MRNGQLVENYLAGQEILRRTISGMVVLHLADMDLIFADQMKRVIAETEPALPAVDDKVYASRLAYDKRDVDEEVRLIKAVRRHMGRILRSIDADDFKRIGIHSVDGPVTLADLLQLAADHIPHHAQYIEEKRKALNIRERAIPFHLASVGVMNRAIA
jgi:hypothetical protein